MHLVYVSVTSNLEKNGVQFVIMSKFDILIFAESLNITLIGLGSCFSHYGYTPGILTRFLLMDHVLEETMHWHINTYHTKRSSTIFFTVSTETR